MDNAFALAGKRVVIIGGGSGIGFAVAEEAKGLGADIVIGSSKLASIENARARIPGAQGAVVDIRDEDSLAHFFAQLQAFDHLIITAGDWSSTMFGSVRTMNIETAKQMLAVRFWGALAAAKHAGNHITPNGSITLTGGMLARRPSAGTVLAATIGGSIEVMAGALAMDLAPVRVNAVCPGIVLTEHVAQSMPSDYLQATVGKLPIARAATPKEAASAYLYLMSNAYVTGQTLLVDGGGELV